MTDTMTMREQLEDSLVELHSTKAAIEQAGVSTRFDEQAIADIATMIRQTERKLRELPKPTPSDIWRAIGGKAHLYKTARLADDGRYVSILGVVCDGTFSIAHPVFGQMHVGCQELTSYCL